MSKLTQEPFVDRLGEDPKEVSRFISIFFDQTKRLFNNALTFGDNFDAKSLRVSFAAPVVNQALAHGLGRVPVGYIVIRRSANIVIYDGTAPFTVSNLYLGSSGIGTATLLVF